MEKKKSNNIVVSIICGILTVFGIVSCAVSFAEGGGGIWMVTDVCYIVLAVLVFYYAIVGYRRPHGNLLKYIIFLYVILRLICVFNLAQIGDGWRAVINASRMGLICYMAGRLHRVKQNLIIMAIITILTLLDIVMGSMEGISTIGVFTGLIIWIDICVAYVLRYKEHKEAGLLDASEK